MWRYCIVFILAALLFSCQGSKEEADARKYYQKGLAFEHSSSPDSAVRSYRQALTLLRKSKDNGLKSSVYNQLGELLLAHNLYEPSYEAFTHAAFFAKDLPDKTNLSRAFRGIGKYYYLYKDKDSAAVFFSKPLAFLADISLREERSSVYNNLANSSKASGRYHEALRFNRLALANTSDSVKILRNYAIRGQLFSLLNRYDSAFVYLQKASSSHDKSVRASAFFKLAELPSQAGVSDSIKYRYLQTAYRLSDSIENAAESQKIGQQEQEWIITEMKARSDSDRIRSVLIASAAILLGAAASFLLYRHYIRRKNEQMITSSRQAQELRERENVSRERQIVDVIRKAGEACSEQFKKTAFYTDLSKKLSQSIPLTYEEQENLQAKTLDAFAGYVQQLSGIVPLSANDALLCSLFQLGLNTKECAACRGISPETIRSQRTRIKKKIPRNFLGCGLAEVIFGQR